MVLGSEVPLTEDILRRTPEFIQDQHEWSAINRPQFNASSNTIVPAGETWFITSIWSETGDLTGAASERTVSTSLGLLLRVTSGTGNTISNQTINFSMPVKVEAGTLIEVVGSGGAGEFGSSAVLGWREPRKI